MFRDKLYLGRRQLIMLASSSLFASPMITLAEGTHPSIHVFKNPQCGCCNAWIDILRDKGFVVTTENVSGRSLTAFKKMTGIPKIMMACHTAKINGYFIEGHVPANDIMRLIADRPNALGLAVPNMPYGSPGMGPEDKRESYNVYLINVNGTAEVFQHYPKAGIQI